MKRRIIAAIFLLCSLVLGGCQTYKPVNGEKLSECLKLVPRHVMETVEEAGYDIELVENPGEEFGLKHVSGLTVPELKAVYIKDDAGKFRQCAVHEVFHAYDDALGYVSGSGEFLGLYEDERDDMKVTGFISAGQYKEDEREYFAEACQMYVYDPGTLQSSAPKTYAYIDALLNP